MASLFEISTNYQSALLQLAEMDIDPQTIDDTLESMEGELEAKAINVAAFVRNLESEAAMVKEAEKAMADRRKALENKAQRMSDYLKNQLLAAGVTKITNDPRFQIAIKKTSGKVVIDDESAIPSDFLRVKTIAEPDKTAIKDAGGCPGAHIENNWSISIK